MIHPKTHKTYHTCGGCGYRFLDEMHVVDHDAEFKNYQKHDNSFACGGYVKMFEDLITQVINPYKSHIKTALDFGCGEGQVLGTLLTQQGIETDHYDLYFYPQKVYENKTYDLITSTEVFEHLKNPSGVFEKLTKHLNPKGYLILMTKFTPNKDDEFLKWWYIRDITHIGFFTPQSFEILARNYGLTLIKTLNDDTVIFQKC
jgi:SAM-dependent methyltransferase